MWGASYLDAFSTYPFQTWLLSYALGRTTDAPEVCPSRSSRTKNSSTQISNAIEVPNTAVDVDSWAVSACYPQGSFYPLSDGPSTRNHRITKPYFRTCSTCMSHSQAPFCLYTLRAISVRTEGTFGRLRYSLGGDRPSQTAHQTLSPHRITAPG